MVLVLKALEFFGSPIIYIPGNHDCLSQYQNKQLTTSSISLHKRQHKLAEGLGIIGFGGSLPGFNETGKEVWYGYPFATEAQF